MLSGILRTMPWSLAIGLAMAGPVSGQPLTILHSFANTPEGAMPYSGLSISGNTLYGATGKMPGRGSSGCRPVQHDRATTTGHSAAKECGTELPAEGTTEQPRFN